MAISWLPHAPYHWIGSLLLVILALTWLLRLPKSRLRELATAKTWRSAAILLTLIAMLLTCAALWGPVKVKEANPLPPRLFVVLDVSASVQRTEGGWPRIRDLVANRIAQWSAAMPALQQQETRATIISFRDTSTLARRQVPLQQLPGVLRNLKSESLAGGQGSNPTAALNRVAEMARQGNTRDAVLLISDGFETRGDASVAAQTLAAQGVPIHVLPIGGSVPALSIAAADVPRHVLSGSQTYLRGTMRQASDTTVNGTLEWQQPGSTEESRRAFELPARGWGRFRWPIALEGLGIDYTQLLMRDEAGQVRHQMRLFTHLKRPPRVLAVGGDWRWISAMEGSGIEVLPRSPETLTVAELQQVDAVIINDVAGPQLDSSWIRQVVRRVEQGMGLFVVNGDHSGLDEKSETVFVSLANTQLGEILPLEAGPRPANPKGSKRQIVMLVDASGSMGGGRLDKAKEIIKYIIETYLGPDDSLDLLAFSTRVLQLVERRNMNDAGKAYAIEQLEKLKHGGGTDPTEALDLLRQRQFNDCGLIFLSDGGFAPVSIRPECRATVFAIGKSSVPFDSPLYELADPFPVPPDFDPRSIRMPYFEPEGRNKYFEEGRFRPLRLLVPQTAGWQVPRLNIQGAAITHLKPEGQLVAVRPKLTDPVLAYRKVGNGMSLAFTAALAGQWLDRQEGREAIQNWVSRLIAYKARDRYDFSISDRGSFAEMSLTLHDREGRQPQLDALRLDLLTPGSEPLELVPYFEDAVRGEWRVRVPLPADGPQRSQLLIREYGDDALDEAQAVPLRLPPAMQTQVVGTQEPAHWGINEARLRQWSNIGGGIYDPTDTAKLFPEPNLEARVEQLWQWFLLAAMICYVAAIASSRLGGR